jgi:hypothetical protein
MQRAKKRSLAGTLVLSVMMLLLAGWVCTPTAWAQFNGTLGTAASATDVWGVLCPSGTSSLRCQVTDTGGSGDNVSFGVCCANTHGPTSGCITAPDGGTSVAVSASPGPGEYAAKIFKATPVGNAAGQETYRVDLTCLGPGGGVVVLLQNQ